jgi:UDP-glucose 4-epimerase
MGAKIVVGISVTSISGTEYSMTILVTGGAGFIGSNYVLDWLAQSRETVVNLDKLSYAGNLQNLASLKDDPAHVFVKGDIGDATLVPRTVDPLSTTRGGEFCGRVACRPVDSWTR